jgi:hypothetical protein
VSDIDPERADVVPIVRFTPRSASGPHRYFRVGNAG